MSNTRVAPLISSAELEATVWRMMASVARGGNQHEAVSRIMTVAREWALCAGASSGQLEAAPPTAPPPAAGRRLPIIKPRPAGRDGRVHLIVDRGRARLCGGQYDPLGPAGYTYNEGEVNCRNCINSLQRIRRAEKGEPARKHLLADDGSIIAPDDGDQRTCRRCKRTGKMGEEFGPDKDARGGFKTRCRYCLSQIRASRREVATAELRLAGAAIGPLPPKSKRPAPFRGAGTLT